jgi:hypothetical protein
VSSSEIDAGLSDDPEDELVQVELDEAHRKRRKGRWRIAGVAAAVLVTGVVFVFALPRIANYGEVWDVVQTLSWQWLVALALATVRRRHTKRVNGGAGNCRTAPDANPSTVSDHAQAPTTASVARSRRTRSIHSRWSRLYFRPKREPDIALSFVDSGFLSNG